MSCCCLAPLDGGTPAGGGASSPAGAAGYELVRAINFAGLPDQALADGAAVDIGGIDWTVEFSATGATWRIRNGSGLEYVAAAAITQLTTAGINCALIRTPWSTLVPNYDPTRRYLLQTRTTLNNGNASAERYAMGVLRRAGVPTGATISLACTFVGHNGVAVMGGFLAANSGGVGSTDYAAADVLSWMASPGSPSGCCGLVGSSVAGAFCPNASLRSVPWNQETGTPGAIAADVFTDPLADVILAFPTGNNSATFAATVAELRVLVAA